MFASVRIIDSRCRFISIFVSCKESFKNSLHLMFDRFFCMRFVLYIVVFNFLGFILKITPKFLRRSLFQPKVIHTLNSQETLDIIGRGGVSFIRFGDGELNIIFGKKGPGFQESSFFLRKELLKVLGNNKVLICLPYSLTRDDRNEFWQRYLENNALFINFLKIILNDRKLGDAQITRPYIAFCNEVASNVRIKRHFDKFKHLFSGRDLLVVEGCWTRFGVGNDLLSQAKSIKRILVPNINASKYYLQIFSELERTFGHNYVYLLACGPVAKILASKIIDREEIAWDVGHLDVEYEWFLKNEKEKKAIPGKYVNEAEVKFDSRDDPFVDFQGYREQIIATVGD